MLGKNLINQAATMELSPDNSILKCSGKWTVNCLADLERALPRFKWPHVTHLIIATSLITEMDTSGAWLLQRVIQLLAEKNIEVEFQKLLPEQQALLDIVASQAGVIKDIPKPPQVTALYELGKKTVDALYRTPIFLEFFGEVLVAACLALLRPGKIYWRTLVSVLESAGYRAMPIVGLLSFLVGIVIAYQMGLQLRNYGANIYIVDLVGLATLREFGPIITAIILAGRTGSAFTAQIGTMKINQEVDALTAMDVDPIDLLVLPKLFGMLIAVPLLTIWADFFGVLGGMLMAQNMLDINFHTFLIRFKEAISLTPYVLGLIKSPFFALAITLIGCYQGFQVTLGADSVGRQTTRSVVQAIFFIIVIDSLFSVYFSWRNL